MPGMKRLLLVSLALNLVLAGSVGWLVATRRHAVPVVIAAPPPPKTPGPKASAPRAASTGESTDVRDWLPQLREAGVPDRVLARLVAANYMASWEKRREQMQLRWERGEIDDDDWFQFNRQRDVAEENAVRAAVGEEAFKAWHEEKLLAGLPLDRIQMSASEREGLYALRRDLLAQQRDLERRNRAGEIDDAQFEQQQEKLQADYEAKTKTLLGDARFATLQSPSESTDGGLRRNLQSLNLPASKIDAIIAAEQQWREQRIAMDRAAGQETSLSPDAYQAKVHELDAAHDAALQQQLGADGLEALRQMQDERYRKLTKYAQLWQLSSDEVNKVYGALRDYNQTVDEYRRQAQSRGLTYEVMQPAIDQFRQSSSASLRAAIGEKKYNQLAGSDVLNWDR